MLISSFFAPRYWPQSALPSYRYIPGKTKKEEKRFDLPSFSLEERHSSLLARHPAYLYGIDLYHHSFFYEAHEMWEQIWLALGKGTAEKKLLQSLIQNAAALLKMRMGQSLPAKRLSLNALRLLEEVSGSRTFLVVMDLRLDLLQSELRRVYQAFWNGEEDQQVLDAPRLALVSFQ